MDEYLERVHAAADYIRKNCDCRPVIGIVLGSGLGLLADSITEQRTISYADIPGFPVSTAPGHAGKLIFGRLAGKEVVAMQGRFHSYEGYTGREITIPQRVMSLLGVKFLFVSNACGGLNPDYHKGDLMVIRDHISLLENPLIGHNLDEFGPRFPDMTRPYDPELRKLASECAAGMGLSVREGVYLSCTGPCYETPAECRFFHWMGADAVGMSTVQEVIVARHCGMSVFGMSVITDVVKDYAKDDYVTDQYDILDVADAAASRMSSLFEKMIGALKV